ncbi:DUF3320 domain-containing protein [Stomatohabitans albus]|uniref:DUF3320 domain-containing protein n=1 Tax=Stomatohabitans albus TaxID=3110766 RepID=UPI00300C2981
MVAVDMFSPFGGNAPQVPEDQHLDGGEPVAPQVAQALSQWRDALVNLDGNNRLLNFRPTRSRTIEFVQQTAAQVYTQIASSQETYVVGLKPTEALTDLNGDGIIDDEDVLIYEMGVVNDAQHAACVFTQKTQAEVDKSLRQTQIKARDEYMDRGIRVLYAGFGELEWTEHTRGDARRSPLVLIPVVLESDRPGARPYIQFSQDDAVINPALSIKLYEEFGIQLPPAEEMMALVEEGRIDDVLERYRSLDWPSGWRIQDRACLDVFAFANEAMYRDLLDNEAQIVQSPIIRAIGGGLGSDASPFDFEPVDHTTIDTVAEPETTPLVLDADSSQRAAIQAAVEGKSFILNGPPGTGKSQTIANIIGALIDAGKSVLFVSEKAVALDVVRDRLTDNGLGPFLFELHSKKANRKAVAAQLGQALVTQPVAPPRMSQVEMSRLRDIREQLTGYVTAANEIREPLGMSFFDLLGRLEALHNDVQGPPFGLDPLTITAETMADLEQLIASLTALWPTALKGKHALWYGAINRQDPRYLFQQILPVLEQIQQLLSETTAIRERFGFNSGSDLQRVATLLETWHREPSFHHNHWLTVTAIPALIQAVARYHQRTVELDQVISQIEEQFGNNWAEVRPLAEHQLPARDIAAGQIPGLTGETTARHMIGIRDGLVASKTKVDTLEKAIQALANHLGAEVPTTFDGVAALIRFAQVMTSQFPPHVGWINDPQALATAKQVATGMHDAYGELSQTAQAVEGVFTEQALQVDLSEIQQLASTSTGLFGRLGSDHKRLRQLIGEISPLPWKDAVEHLPKAQAWAQASQRYHELNAQAQTVFASFLTPDAGLDWEKIRRTIQVTEQVQGVTIIHPHEAEQLVLDSGKQAAARQYGAAVQQLLHDVQTNHLKWTQADGVVPTALGTVTTRLNERIGIAEDLVRVVMRFQQLGPDVPIQTYVAVAYLRTWADSALQAATQARHALHAAAPLDQEAKRPSLHEAEVLMRKVEWIKAMHTAVTQRPSAHRYTPEQLDALAQSYPIAESGSLVSRYQTLAEQFLEWFTPERQAELREDSSDYASAYDLFSAFNAQAEGLMQWFELQEQCAKAQNLGLGDAVSYALTLKLPPEKVHAFLLATVYRSWIDAQLGVDHRFSFSGAASRDDLVIQFRDLDKQLQRSSISTIIEKGLDRRPRSLDGQARVIQREAEKKRKHIPVYDLINQARDVILRLHPCFMMSPHSVSQYLPPERMFDVVIFDEASQVRPGDAINCFYRASAVIVAGDQKQLPPTDFFQTMGTDLDEEGEEHMSKDYESILDLMKASGAFRQQTLNWHYRSRHEHLIAFSNMSFYESKLITFPGALDKSEDAGVNFYKVPGVYMRSKGRTNPIEAKKVAERVMHHFTTRPTKSLGVVTFSIAQEEAVANAVELARKERPDLDQYFTDDRSHGFFIKTLEKVQGDERDVIIFSIGYGPDEHGRVYNTFGPINGEGGERRLNVAVTRAKELIEVVSSMSASDIRETGSAGVRHFKRYLDYAERGPVALSLELGPEGRDTESPFEDSVVDYIRSLGYEVQPQVGVAGYRIDIGVKHPDQPGAFMIGVECDGAMYHSSRAARDRDRLRHEILEGLGWQLHHIWGTDWYRYRSREQERLKAVLETAAAQPVVGRMSVPDYQEQDSVVEIQSVEIQLDDNPSWVQDYTIADLEDIPDSVDIRNPINAVRIKDFIETLVRAEAPIHMSLVNTRIREHSSIDSVGSRIKETIRGAIELADVMVRDDFLYASSEVPMVVRRNTPDCVRKIDQIAPEELEYAILCTIDDAIGIERTNLIPAVATVLGFQRTGPDIRRRIETTIDQLLHRGLITEQGGGLTRSSS